MTLKDIVQADSATLSPDELAMRRAIERLAQWCDDYGLVLEKGRKHGLRFGLSESAREALIAAEPTPAVRKAVANILVIDQP